MIPYGQHEITEQDREAVQRALTADRITQGPELPRFEEALCERFGCNYAVVVNSGTLALQIAYDALGIGTGDEIVTTPLSFVATTNGLLHNGARPRFVDIDPDTFNLSIDLLRKDLNQKKNPDHLKAIVGVHFAGLPLPMGKLKSLADEHNAHLIEDACHAPGARWRDSTGTWHNIGNGRTGDVTLLSFHPVKHFTAGEGGAILTNDSSLADTARRLRTHGINYEPDDPDGPWSYEMTSLGYNGRMTELQAALGRSQLERLDSYLDRRRHLARRYDEAFENLGAVTPQNVPLDREHAYHLYVIRVPRRNDLFEFLVDRGVAPQVHYLPIPCQPYYREQFGYQSGDFPAAEQYYREALSLPLYPTLGKDEQQKVIELIYQFFGEST